MILIGISGTFGSGKDTVAKIFAQNGFNHLSSADVLREEARKLGRPTDRESLRILSNEMRQKSGSDILARLAWESMKKYDKIAISALRSTGEIDFIKSKGGHVIFADAPIKVRYSRIQDRSRGPEDQTTFDEFMKKEELESSGQSSQDLPYCKEHADILIDNSGSEKDLRQGVLAIISHLENKE